MASCPGVLLHRTGCGCALPPASSEPYPLTATAAFAARRDERAGGLPLCKGTRRGACSRLFAGGAFVSPSHQESAAAPSLSSKLRKQLQRKCCTKFPSRRGQGRRNEAASRHVQAAYISPPAPADTWETGRDNDEDDVRRRTLAGRLGEPALLGVHASKPQPVITMGLILRLVFRDKARLLLAAASLVGGTCCTLVMPQFSGRFFETLIGRREGPLHTLLASLAAVYVAEPLLTVAYVTSLVTVWETVLASLRSLVFRRLLVQKVEFFDRHSVAELTSVLSAELGSIEKVVNENVSRDRGFRSLSEVLGTLVILWFLSKDLAPAFAFLILGISAGVAVYKRMTAPVFKAHAAAQARIIERANESFGAIRTVRSFGGERRQMAGFDQQVRQSQTSGTRLGWLKSANESYTRIAVYASLLVVYFMGGAKVKAGQLPVGTMVSFIGYTFTLTFAMQGLVNTLADVRNVVGAVGRINALAAGEAADVSLEVGLEREERGEVPDCSDSDDNAGAGAAAAAAGGSPTPLLMAATRGRGGALQTLDVGRRRIDSVCELAWTGDVVFEDVSFAYPERFKQLVLKGVNLRLPRGTVTALVGASGAGKSTVVQLLSRFYEPTEGRLTLGGQDVRAFDKSEWARAVSLVNQEPVLFAVSVKENIAYGLPNDDVSMDDVVAAAKAANAHEFVTNLPQGYDTNVGERGSLLSGGQRQRVAIARALLKNSPILLLDEATSALDSVSERLVQGALERLMRGRTTLVIAHRLSTVQSADQIAVMAAGEVIELGPHAELVAKGGAYSELVHSQRLSFE